jgi:hypothetical protein
MSSNRLEGFDKKLHSLPEDMCHILQSRFVIDGAVQLTRADVVSLFDDFRASIRDACESFNTVHVGAEGLQQEGECYTGRLFIWADGSMRRAPEDWIFPSINCKTMWDMWYKGDRSKEIGPFRFLTQKDIKDKKTRYSCQELEV